MDKQIVVQSFSGKVYYNKGEKNYIYTKTLDDFHRHDVKFF